MNDDETTVEFHYTLLVVDDEESIRITLSEALANDHTTVHSAATGKEAIARVESEKIDLVLLDQNLKESSENGIDVLRKIKEVREETLVIMMTAYGKIESAVEATKLGCYQYLTKPLELAQLRLLIRNALSTIELRKEVESTRIMSERHLGGAEPHHGPAFFELLDKVRRVAQSGTTTVLVRGQTGTGKELISRMIHLYSGAKGPFVDLNCAALPDHLLESELFGHEAGAFTDARKMKRGLLELADRGTLFLDEIGEMPLALQAKLLRVLETRTFRRVGSTGDIKVHTRFIAATNKDLFQEVEAKTFREDLYYRLSVIPIYVPALKDRPEDISILSRYFLDKYTREVGGKVTGISQKALEKLCDYSWPGNVRELKNLMEHAALLANGPELLPDDLPPRILAGAPGAGADKSGDVSFLTDKVVPLAEVECAAIAHALQLCGGNKTRAAELLGIARQTLRTKVKEYGLESESEPARN